jgi:hypothetical protein
MRQHGREIELSLITWFGLTTQACLLSGKGPLRARVKTPSETVRARFALAGRITALRSELFGERGGAEMARRLGLPLRTWYNYERGTAIPAEVVLRIIELTAAEPGWLLHGTGPKYRPMRPAEGDETGPPTRDVRALLREALELLEREEWTAPTTAR